MPTQEAVVESLKQVYDPEIPVNIYDLGLIYNIAIDGGRVDVQMTLTSAFCPAAQSLPPTVERKILEIPGVTEAKVAIVWDPPWDQTMISEEGKAMLGVPTAAPAHTPTPGKIEVVR